MEAAAIEPPPGRGLRPIGFRERIDTIDVLRGLAILGILFVNIHDFSFPPGFGRFHAETFGGVVDQTVRRGLQLLIEAKFYSMFSFLFGLGAAVQMSRAEQRGEFFSARYVRRLLVLLAIGLVHDIFLWTGGILIAYSTLGFLLLPFRKRRPKTLLLWAAGLILVPLLVLSIVIPLTADTPNGRDDSTAVEETEAEEDAERRVEFEEVLTLFQSGRYVDQVKYRVREFPKMLLAILGLSGYVVAMFLLGAWTWRVGIFQNLDDHIPLLRRILLWALIPGVLGNLLLAWMRVAYSGPPPVPMMIAGGVAYLIGNPALCFVYVSAVVLLVRRPGWRRLFSPLAPVGRTALSNYLFQTFVCTTLFYSYGLAWFGRTGPAVNLALTVAILTVQVALSGWWVRRFRFGPAEWLWRSLTYRRMQPMKLDSPPRRLMGTFSKARFRGHLSRRD
jgi:uncharacterized protein